jgi:hypothetical protein
MFRKTVAVVALLMPGAAWAQLVQNGDFSQGPGFTTNVVAGSGAITDWTVGGTSVDYVLADTWQLPPGAGASVDLNGGGSNLKNAKGGISQSFATLTGARYVLKFQRSANPTVDPQVACYAGAVKKFEVGVGDAHHRYSWDLSAEGNTVGDMKWTPERLAFTATDAVTTLTFKSLNGGWCGAVVTLITVAQAKGAASVPAGILSGLH